MENVPGVMLAGFATIRINVVQVIGLPLPFRSRRGATMGAPKSQTIKDSKSSTKVLRPEDTVPHGKGARDCADISSQVSSQILRVTCGIFPCVKGTSHSQVANMAISVRSCTEKRTVSQGDRKMQSGQGSVAIVRIAKNWGCVCQAAEPPKVKPNLRKRTNSLRPRRRVHFLRLKLCSPPGNGTENPSRGVISPTYPHERSFFAPTFEDRTQEDTLEQERARREAWDLARSVNKLKENRGKAAFFSPSGL